VILFILDIRVARGGEYPAWAGRERPSRRIVPRRRAVRLIPPAISNQVDYYTSKLEQVFGAIVMRETGILAKPNPNRHYPLRVDLARDGREICALWPFC
jgi:hypothetical protein